MKKILTIAALITTTVHAELESSAYEYYKMNNIISNKVIVELITTDDVNKRCNQENRKQGFAEFRHKIQGCAFWRANDKGQMTCMIIVGKKTNNDILGHEIRHCFVGEFH